MSEQNGDEVHEFRLVRITRKIKMIGEDGTTESMYTIKELTGEDRDKYITDMGQRVKYGQDGKPSGLNSFVGIQSKLLALCLYDNTDKLVPEAIIRKWPSRVQGDLFAIAQKISGLEQKEAEETSKNA